MMAYSSPAIASIFFQWPPALMLVAPDITSPSQVPRPTPSHNTSSRFSNLNSIANSSQELKLCAIPPGFRQWHHLIETQAYMYDQQSQTPSTHQAPFEARLKKTLRLNRDLVLFYAYRQDTGSPWERPSSYSRPKSAVVKAGICR